MAQKLGNDKQEQELARTQRQALKAELAENFAQRPRGPRNRRRIITFMVLGFFALLVGLFGLLILLPSPSQLTAGVAVGTAAPEFNLPVYGGRGLSGSIDLHALRGHPVIINFWSENCPPCRTEIPYLQRTYAQYGARGEFTLLGINQADPKDDIARFGTYFAITYPLLFDKGSLINAAYNVTALPTTYFIDSNGIVRSVFVQQLTLETMRQGLSSVGIIIQ